MSEEKKTTIYLIRHGEREDHINPSWRDNAERPFDPPLSPFGIEQAKETGKFLKTLNPDMLLTSPFFRTLQTSHEIASTLGLKQNVEFGLAEWLIYTDDNPFKFTPPFDLSGLQSRFPLLSSGLEKTSHILPSEYNFPESTREELHKNRLQKFSTRLTDFVIQQKKPLTLLLITHGAISRGLPDVLANKTIDYTPPYCSLTKIVLDDVHSRRWVCEYIGNDDHLPEEMRQKTKI